MRFSLYRILPIIILLSAFPAMAQNKVVSNEAGKYYYQCATHIGPSESYNDPGYKSVRGYIGLFQFSLMNGYEAGLCSNPVPAMRQEQLWNLCDFKGPIAIKYNIRDQYDLRYDGNARIAQFEMMRNLTKVYDDYIYQKKYDLFFGKFISGVVVDSDVLRILLHTKGRAATAAFLNEDDVTNNRNNSPFNVASCLKQCMSTKAKNWFCN